VLVGGEPPGDLGPGAVRGACMNMHCSGRDNGAPFHIAKEGSLSQASSLFRALERVHRYARIYHTVSALSVPARPGSECMTVLSRKER
jgi:hypothetical protein